MKLLSEKSRLTVRIRKQRPRGSNGLRNLELVAVRRRRDLHIWSRLSWVPIFSSVSLLPSLVAGTSPATGLP